MGKLQRSRVDIVVGLLLIDFKQETYVNYAFEERHIGKFDSREKANLAHEIAREILKMDKE